MGRMWREVAGVLRGDSITHRLLRDRLVALALATFLIDLVMSWGVYFAERREPASMILDYPDALFWTTTQLLSVSNSMPAPLTGIGRWLDVLAQIWAITVVAGLAGSLGTFFHWRGFEKHAEHYRELHQPKHME